VGTHGLVAAVAFAGSRGAGVRSRSRSAAADVGQARGVGILLECVVGNSINDADVVLKRAMAEERILLIGNNDCDYDENEGKQKSGPHCR